MAIVAGLARVYLLQHFFIDIFFGALVGIGVTLITYWYMKHASLEIKGSLSGTFHNRNL
jgi:membrane-associated phospholipid phosphatase